MVFGMLFSFLNAASRVVFVAGLWAFGPLHVYTAFIAYERFGFLSGLIALAMPPPLPEIYYFFKTAQITGEWMNFYNFWVFALLGVFALAIALFVLSMFERSNA